VSSRGPDFDELVGSDLDGGERDRLRRVHELLVQAGPPPEMSTATAPSLVSAPAPPRRGRRRRGALIALAAALGVAAAFTIGLVLAESDNPSADRVVAMSGPGGASASIEVNDLDDAGNWPMLLEVEGLPPAEGGRLFQLWLTRGSELKALCGSFLTAENGRAVVPMNAPRRLDDFDGWVVVVDGSTEPVLTT
jgi:hypothetical protein